MLIINEHDRWLPFARAHGDTAVSRITERADDPHVSGWTDGMAATTGESSAKLTSIIVGVHIGAHVLGHAARRDRPGAPNSGQPPRNGRERSPRREPATNPLPGSGSGSCRFAGRQAKSRQEQLAILRVPERIRSRHNHGGEGHQPLDDRSRFGEPAQIPIASTPWPRAVSRGVTHIFRY